ncbi:hypothetical protein VaNZ11_013127, partial [Volvox africanus]
MELYNLVNHRVLTLESGKLTTVGRGIESGISSPVVSRNHCTIVYSSNLINETGSIDVDVRLTVLHTAGAVVIRGPRARHLGLEPMLLLPANASCQLYAGDKIFLERRDGRLVSGLELRASRKNAVGGGDDGTAAAATAALALVPPTELSTFDPLSAAQHLTTPIPRVRVPPPSPVTPGSPSQGLADKSLTHAPGHESVTRGTVAALSRYGKSVQRHSEEAQQQGQAVAAVGASRMGKLPVSISHQPPPEAAEDGEPTPNVQAVGGAAPQGLCETCTPVPEPAMRPPSTAPSRRKRRLTDVSVHLEAALPPPPVPEAAANTAASDAATTATR